ncbi:MAG: amidohydrolase [Segetibacter sp.]|nr:amidohydrolase [Segetibacter sp.]
MTEWIKHIPVIDTHLHLWDVNRLDYPWLKDVAAINQTFLIADYQAATRNFSIEKMVFVQCECLPEQGMEEVQFVMEQALIDQRIKGIVAYAPLEQGKGVAKALDVHKNNALIKGVRRMYDDSTNLCHSSAFLDGLNMLPSYNLSFDISVKPHALSATVQMIKNCPDTAFILDHLGKPNILNKSFKEFQENIDQLASLPNVVAKLSGLITEGDWAQWTVQDLKPYIDHAVKVFGLDRLMFGGDWPVVLLAGSFEEWLNTLSEALQFSNREEALQLFHDNAERIYKL